MERPFIEAKFYETYYFSNVVRNVLHIQDEYMRNLWEFYGDDQYLHLLRPFEKFSALHCFIQFLLINIITEDTEDLDLQDRQNTYQRFSTGATKPALEDLELTVLPIEHALLFHNIEHQSFESWLNTQSKTFLEATDADIDEYLESLKFDCLIDELLDRAVNEVFFVLFQNRNLLLLFNQMTAEKVSQTSISELTEEHAPLFKRDGVLNRCNIPKWVQRAVFFRDRGMCVVCKKDLSGILSTGSIENYDHIVPLSQGGMNDVSNIQLLCRECNALKSDGAPITSEIYETWYT